VRDLLGQSGALDWPEALRIASGVLAALEYSTGWHRAPRHQAGERDADPSRRDQGHGLRHRSGAGRQLGDDDPDQAVIGTAQYSRRAGQGQQVDARSDIYSTGCLLFELLTGRPPFIGDSPVSVAYQHVGENPVPPSSLVAGIPAEVDAIVLHALAKDRDARYQSAANMRADCESLLAGGRSARGGRCSRRTGRAVPGLTAEAAMAASALATEAYAMPEQATRHALATEAIPAGLGDATMSSDGMGIGLPPGDGGAPPSSKPNRAPAFVLLGLAAIAAIVLLLIFGPKIFGGGGDNVAQVTVPPVTSSARPMRRPR